MTSVLFERNVNCRELHEVHKDNKAVFFSETLIELIRTSSYSALSNYIKFLVILS